MPNFHKLGGIPSQWVDVPLDPPPIKNKAPMLRWEDEGDCFVLSSKLPIQTSKPLDSLPFWHLSQEIKGECLALDTSSFRPKTWDFAAETSLIGNIRLRIEAFVGSPMEKGELLRTLYTTLLLRKEELYSAILATKSKELEGLLTRSHSDKLLDLVIGGGQYEDLDKPPVYFKMPQVGADEAALLALNLGDMHQMVEKMQAQLVQSQKTLQDFCGLSMNLNVFAAQKINFYFLLSQAEIRRGKLLLLKLSEEGDVVLDLLEERMAAAKAAVHFFEGSMLFNTNNIAICRQAKVKDQRKILKAHFEGPKEALLQFHAALKHMHRNAYLNSGLKAVYLEEFDLLLKRWKEQKTAFLKQLYSSNQ